MLVQLSERLIPAVETEMRAVMNADGQRPTLYDGMIHYHMGWVTAEMEPDEVPSGKRIRPLLCLLCCESAGGNWRQAVPAAASIEILHNFTLVHDDIQDHSPTRRGRPTVWTIWGVEQAINTGDAMFAQAHLAMVRLAAMGVDAGITVHALRRLDETCIELTKGQHADMLFEGKESVSVDDYLTMINGKTAVLLSLAAELGALIAGKDSAIVEHYAQFARNLGLAFQVRDDILGIWGDESAIGKSAATDIETRKKSLPVLYGLGRSGVLTSLYQETPSPTDFVARAISLLDSCGARQYAEQMESQFTEEALGHLTETGHEGDGLDALARFLLGRTS